MPIARFNRHRPALCLDCGAPLSVRERRNAGPLGAMVCTWDDNRRIRETFNQAGADGYWTSAAITLPDADVVQHFTISLDPGEVYGLYLQEDVGDDEAGEDAQHS